MSLAANSLADQVSSAINGNPYLTSRDLRFEAHEGKITLHGVVSSYYQKQMAQEMLRRVEGIEGIVNNLEVCWAG